MNLLNRFRSSDYSPRRRRYTNGDFADIEDISDPHSREDETSTSLKEWLLENKSFVVLAIPTGAALTLLVLYYVARLAPEFAQSRYVQGGVALSIYTLALVYLSVTRYRANRDSHDKLELDLEEGGKELRGWYVEATDESGADMFVPALGIDWTGSLGNPMTMGDFGHAVAESWAKANMDVDHPATIRLTGTHNIVETDMGRTIQDRGKDLKVDEFARASAMRVVPPDSGSEYDLINIREQLTSTEEELSATRRELSAEKRRGDNMSEIAEQSQDELMERLLKFYTTIQAVNGRSGRQMPSLEFDEQGDPMIDDWMDEVNNEVAIDDD